MSTLATGKIAEVMFENAIETFEHQDRMLDLVTVDQHEQGSLQNAGNEVWRPVQQHAPIIPDWDLGGKETGIIEETYPASLGLPSNDFVKQRIDDLRDMRFWERRGKESGKAQASYLNKLIAEKIKTYGSLIYELDTSSGYDFVSFAKAMLDERQVSGGQRYFLLNDADNLVLSRDLAARETVQGRPEKTWQTGLVGKDIAEFDIYVGSFLPHMNNNPWGSNILTGIIQYGIPEGGSVNTESHEVINVDYRKGQITFVTAPTNPPVVGDKFKIYRVGSTGPFMKIVGSADKSIGSSLLGEFTATVVNYSPPTISFFPKAIPATKGGYTIPALTDLMLAYGNTEIPLNSSALAQVVDGGKRANLFWDKTAVEVLVGSVPSGKFKEFAGLKTISHTMKNGIDMFMVYDGNIEDVSFRFRLFTWYGITIAKPQCCGVALKT